MENIDLLSSFLDVEELNKIPESIKEKLCMHIEVVQSETKCMKASAALHLANEEQQYLDLEKKFLTTKSQLENEDAECTKLKCKVKDLEEQFTQASSKAKELATSEHDNLSTQLRLSRCNESLEAEKRELSEQLERKNREIDRLNEEWKQMSNKLTTANQRRCEAQAKLDGINSQAISNKFSEERWAQEKKLLEQQVSWLNADGNRKEKELYSLRQETSGKVLQLQMQLDGKSEEAVGLQENVDLLANTNREQEQKLEQLIDKLKESHTTHIKSEEQFQAELHAQTKLAGLYHNSSEEAEGKVLELMTAVHELQKLLKQAAVTHTQLEQKYGEDTRALQASVDDGNGKLDALAKELENANDLLSAARPHGHASMTSEQLEELLPTAATTSKLLKSGMTLTQIYNEYVQTSSALELERLENKRLNQYLEQILQEIEEKAPIVKRWREGYENSLRTIADMTRQHECALQEIDALRCQAIDARRTSGQLERDSARMRQQVADLGQQVQLLLKEVEEARGGRVSVRNESDICDAEISSSSQLISERLVTFRSIGELQEQNQQLLAVVRELSEKQEAEEKRLTDSKTQELQEQLNAATKDLEELRAARQRQADMVESIVRQRDMYRVLLADTSVAPSENGSMITSTPSVPHGQDKELGETKAALSQMQREFDTYKVEKAENTNLLMSQQDKLRVSLSELQIQNAQLSSQFEFTQERYKILQSNVENYKREIAALREKNVKFTANVMLYQQNISTLTQEVTKLQEKLARAETDAENFKAERDILKSVEARLVTERDAVAREQRGQSVLLANLQTLQNNLERSEQETQRRLTNQVENLERECALLRRKHDAEVAHGRAAAKGWDSQVRELRAQLESELRAHQKTREDRSGDTERVASLKSDLCDAEVKLAAAESRLSAAEKPEPARSAAKEELEECHAQLAAAQQEARGVRAQLEQATRSADQYRAIADSVERSLAEQNEASRTLQAVCESRVAEARRASDDLAQRLAATQRQHDAAAQENACLLEQNATQGGTLRRQLVAAQNELAETLAQQKDAAAREGAARDDLTAQAGVAADAQVKYERELVLHAADVQSLTTVREQLDGVMTRARTAEDAAAKADETLSSKQASWEERERALKSECAQLETRSGELQQHNEVLHAQMETMSTQMLAVRARGGSADTSLSDTLDMSIGDDGQKSSEQLLEILRYLRREKEIATTQHEVARADAARQKVRVAQLERQTQELQASIAEERRRGERSARTVGEHAALMEKVEHLNVLVDSNKLLRDEKERATMQAQEQQSRAARLEAELLPVKKSLWEARTLRDALQTESAALRDEVKRWETRTNQLLERSSQVDAEEYRKLVDEKEKQRKQFLALVQEQSGKHKQEREQVDAQAAALTADVARLQASLAAAEKQLAASRSEHSRQSQEVASRQSEEAGTLRKQLAAANARVAKLAQEVAALRGEVADKNQKIQSELKQLNQVRKIGRKYKTQFDELKLEYENYVSQVAAARGAEERGAGGAQEQQRLEARVQELEAAAAAHDAERRALADEAQRLTDEIAQLRKAEEQLKTQLGETERIKKVLQQAKQRILQISSNRDKIASEIDDLKQLSATASEEHESKLTAAKAEYEGRLAKLTQELTEAQEARNASRQEALQLGANVEQLNRRLETRQKQLSQQQSSKPSASTSTNDRTSSSSEPPTANIKPIATPAAAQKHAAAVTSVSSGSSKAATPTASIRPMAISSQQTPTATVMPTPSSVEFHEEQITGPPTISPTPRQATVQPTQAQAIPAIIITPHVEEEEVIVQVHPPPVEHQEVAQPAEVPVFPLEGIPEHHHHQQQQQQSQPQQQQQQHDQPAVSATEPSRGQTAGKRPREQEIADTTVATEAASEEVPIKRVRAEVETEDSASQGAADEEFTEGELGEAEGELGEAEGELGEAEAAGDDEEDVDESDDVILVESDEEEVAGIQPEEFPEDYEEEEAEDTYDVGEMEEGDFDTAEDEQLGEEEMHEDLDFEEGGEEMVQDEMDQEEVVMAEEASDEDVVEIIDDEEDDDNDGDADDDIESEAAHMDAQESGGGVATTTAEALPTLAVAASVPAGTARQHLGGGAAIPAVDAQRPGFLPQIRTERLSSMGRGSGGAFAPGQAPVYDDGDGIVPSTPTLSVPRRNDGFAEAISSPQVQARFTFGGGGEASSSVPSQLASQGALGMDDTKMDLSQFDEGEGRSIPTTPSGQRSPAALSAESAPAAAAEPGPLGEVAEHVVIVTEEEALPAERAEGAAELLESKQVEEELAGTDAGDVHATAEAIVEEPAEEGEGGERPEDDVVLQTGDEVELEGDRQDEREGDTDGQSQAQPGDGGEKRPAQRKPIVWTEPSEPAASAASAQPPAIPPLTQPLPVQRGKPQYRGRRGKPLGRGTAQSQRVMPSQQRLPQQMQQIQQMQTIQQLQQLQQQLMQQQPQQQPPQPVYRGMPMQQRGIARGRGGQYRGSSPGRNPFRRQF